MTEIWTLVLINIMLSSSSGHHEPLVEGYWTFDTMIECFEARSILGLQISGEHGTFPKGSQAVCIPRLVNQV